jgi:hypothetical protein
MELFNEEGGTTIHLTDEVGVIHVSESIDHIAYIINKQPFVTL